jgi:hypothetical protein
MYKIRTVFHELDLDICLAGLIKILVPKFQLNKWIACNVLTPTLTNHIQRVPDKKTLITAVYISVFWT